MSTIADKLKYGSKLHHQIRDAVGDRFDMSRVKMANRFKKWRESEDLFMFYVKETPNEERRRLQRENTGKQTFSTIYVPYSYATLMSAFTYWTAVFLSRNPIIQFTGRHGEAEQKSRAVEAVIDYQVQVGQMMVPLYVWLLDAGKYGVGILAVDWVDEYDIHTKEIKKPVMFGDFPVPGEFEDAIDYEFTPRYKGNRIFNVRPYDFLIDPKVSFINLQRGEFCGRITTESWNHILRRATLPANEGGYFNIDDLRKQTASSRMLREREQGSPRVELPDDELFLWKRNTDWERSQDAPLPIRAELVEMCIEIVPKQWGLGKSDYPEKWMFTLGDREVVIGCRPLGAKHNLFPYFIQSYEPDPYSFSSRGVMEILKPLNDTLTWLFNSRMYNVRKSHVDQFIYDPSRIVEKDLMDSEPGRMVRLRPEFYGTDVQTVLQQIPTLDITKSHIQDSGVVMELMQRVSGVNDNNMGVVFPGGRKTATEVRTSASFGINRLKTVSEFNSSLGWGPLAQALLCNTQQYMDEEIVVKIAGSLMKQAKTIRVAPGDIAGFYDFVPVDGTLPIDRFALATLWKEILIALQQLPQVAMRYDIAGIFSWMAQTAGLKNIDQFELTPDQVMMQQLQAGNMVPGGGAAGPMAGGPAPAGNGRIGPNGIGGNVPGPQRPGGTPEIPGLAALLGGGAGPGPGA